MASLANKDEAEKCRDMAKKFLGRGESEKAVRFFEKSLKLYPLPGVEAMRDIAKVTALEQQSLELCDYGSSFAHWGRSKTGQVV